MSQETIIIRHARTYTNIRQSESMDPEITDFGRKQAANVGKFLAKHVDLEGFMFYTSPFLRCLQTADLIGRHLLGSCSSFSRFIVEPLLREYINHCGREVSIPCYNEMFKDMNWKQFNDKTSIQYKDEYNEEFLNRLHRFKAKMPQRTLVVTHGLPAFALLHVVANNVNYVPIWDHSMDNCSITYIVNGRVIWHGRNLYHECGHDPFDKSRAFDAADLLVPKV